MIKNSQRYKKILIISNPFGYGPTGRAIDVARSLLSKNLYDTKIIFGGSGLCTEIFDVKNVKILNVDQRDEEAVSLLIKNEEITHVISVLNRFAVLAAKRNGIKSAFIDELAWLWKKIPKEHLLADRIYWIDVPWFNKMPLDRVKIVSPLITIPYQSRKQNQILFGLGGICNPLCSDFPTKYLDLVAKVLQGYRGQSKIVITSSIVIIEYLKKKINHPNIFLKNLKHTQYLKRLAESSVHINNGGMIATMEALGLKIPTCFFLPSNLAQYNFIEKIKEEKMVDGITNWCDIVDIQNEYLESEKSFISYISILCDKVLNNHEILQLIINEFNNQASGRNSYNLLSIYDKSKKNIDGSQEIVNDLITNWRL